MITSIFIVCIIFIIIKLYKLDVSNNNKIIVFLFSLSIPILYLQFLSLTNNLYEINIKSGLESVNLNLEVRDGYIGEKLEDKYIIYQQDKDIEIPLNNLMIEKNSDDYSFEELTVVYDTKITFNNDFKKWLSKDFLVYKQILNKNKELEENQTTEVVYDLKIKDDLKIKGDE